VLESTKVLTITVTYKSAPWTAKSLEALHAERARVPGIDLTAIIVDNASGDSAELAPLIAERGWGDWATLITADRNGGFAYGNNVAFAHAYARGEVPDFFYLLNPDAAVRPGAVGTLVEFLESTPGAGLAASSIEEATGELWPYAFRFPSWASELESGLNFGLVSRLLDGRTVRRKMTGDAPTQVDWFPGASMMLRREVVDEIGGMDESYFLYFEETDYLLRAKEAGWQAWYVPKSRVVHAAGQSTGVTTRRTLPQRLPDYWFESRRRYFAKNHGLPYALATDVAAFAAHALGTVKRGLQRRPSVPHFLGDLLRHSALWPRNREVEPVRQFRP
jgi:N-acetylglucosaminyl-diphospho-decaprenol L-rhamnosyltransferase